MITIANTLANAQLKITQAAQSCSRKSDDIKLLAVTKTKSITQIIEAYDAGQRLFGENYVQEGQAKIIALKPDYPDIEWHFIGNLQTNKTKVIATHFDWLHTLSRVKIAKRLDQQCNDNDKKLNICIQINISGETSKSGVSPDEVDELAALVDSLPKLTLRGLMAIPSNNMGSNDKAEHPELTKMYDLYRALQRKYSTVDTLSMGMSNDLEAAISAGATLVRIGRAIFGARGC